MFFKRTVLSLAFVGVFSIHGIASVQAQAFDVSDSKSMLNMDEEMAAIADRVQGFAGYTVENDGSLTVRIAGAAKNGHIPSATSRALSAYFGKDFSVRTAEFNARELFQWKVKAAELLGQDGVTFVDLDEARNRIVVGLVSNGKHQALSKVRAAIAKMGLPTEALVLETTSAIKQQATVRDRLRPIAAGAQIAIDIAPLTSFFCTLGANVKRAGVAGFVTAAHCGGTADPLNGKFVYQPVPPAAGDFFGRVAAIGPLLSSASNPACPAGKKCKFADALFVSYTNASTAQFGKLYYTTAWQNLNIASTRTIKAVESTPASSKTLFATGRTNGTSKLGSVARTCVTATGNLDGGIVALCVHFVNRSFGQQTTSGDSGGPYFTVNADNTVNLSGIVYGNSTDFQIYTPWTEVRKQLGDLLLN